MEGLIVLVRDEFWRLVAPIRADSVATRVVGRTEAAVLGLVDRATVLVREVGGLQRPRHSSRGPGECWAAF